MVSFMVDGYSDDDFRCIFTIVIYFVYNIIPVGILVEEVRTQTTSTPPRNRGGCICKLSLASFVARKLSRR